MDRSRMEAYLAAILGKDGGGGLPSSPGSRIETYLAYLAGEDVELPDTPISSAGELLEDIADGPDEGEIDTFLGAYDVTPSPADDKILPTRDKRMSRNLIVRKIPLSETSNSGGGYTAVIGG